MGGGYGYVGENPDSIKKYEDKIMDEENHRIVKRFFSKEYLKSEKSGLVQRSEKRCVRSWSYDDLPLIEKMKTTKNGLLIIVGGTNTGTTTIAPLESLLVSLAFQEKNKKGNSVQIPKKVFQFAKKHKKLVEMSAKIRNSQ